MQERQIIEKANVGLALKSLINGFKSVKSTIFQKFYAEYDTTYKKIL